MKIKYLRTLPEAKFHHDDNTNDAFSSIVQSIVFCQRKIAVVRLNHYIHH